MITSATSVAQCEKYSDNQARTASQYVVNKVWNEYGQQRPCISKAQGFTRQGDEMKSGEYKLFCTKCDASAEGYGNSDYWAEDCIWCGLDTGTRSFMEGFKIL